MSALLGAIQRHVGVDDDGIWGRQTERAVAVALGLLVDATPTKGPPTPTHLTVTEESRKKIMEFECGGRVYYNSRYARPSWPGGASGTTVGCGYDLAYNSKEQIEKDWGGIVSETELRYLKSCSGIKGSRAKAHRNRIRPHVYISFDEAWQVFLKRSIPRFAKLAAKAFPNAKNLHPVTQAAILSVTFNRGASKVGYRRRHMAQMARATTDEQVRDAIEASKAIWPNFKGVRNRRDKEVAMIDNRHSDDSERVRV
jgi:GH24 family phage-related lysozyme (muramidase)